MKNYPSLQFFFFLALLGGVIFFVISLMLPPTYYSSYSLFLTPKNNNLSNYEQGERMTASLVKLFPELIQSDTFLKGLANNLTSGDLILFDYRPENKDWKKTFSYAINQETKILKIKIYQKDPRLAIYLAEQSSITISEIIPRLMNTNDLEIKTINGPSKALIDMRKPFRYGGIGILVGGCLALLIRALSSSFPSFLPKKKTSFEIRKEAPKNKTLFSSYREACLKNKGNKKMEKKEKQKKIVRPLMEELEPKETLEEDQIKERLNRLINGDF